MMITYSFCIVECWHVFVCAFTSQSDYAAMAFILFILKLRYSMFWRGSRHGVVF
ncbi:hypothetical protein HanLR1_Chr09g0302131 [Helianthus annuus]|nr:hypothetical protein HanHA89_Chr09g0322461 [Helianthus annuus]KAJ0706016.1 hypothetical protein HanLR1_Chr09g0302131 [Helianthus annuus]